GQRRTGHRAASRTAGRPHHARARRSDARRGRARHGAAAPRGAPSRAPREAGAGAGAGRPSVARVIGHALAQARQARREGKRGSGAVFVRTVVAEGSPRWLVGVVMVLFFLLAGAVYGVYWLLSTQVEATTAAQRSAEDSVRLVTRRLERGLEVARAG